MRSASLPVTLAMRLRVPVVRVGARDDPIEASTNATREPWTDSVLRGVDARHGPFLAEGLIDRGRGDAALRLDLGVCDCCVVGVASALGSGGGVRETA